MKGGRELPRTRNRARLLYLIEIFHSETDEEHFLSMKVIKDRLEELLHETTSTRAIGDDIEYLRERRNVIEKTAAHGHMGKADLKSAGRKPVPVRVRFSAPSEKHCPTRDLGL